jgi:hypothetical protein
MEGDDTPRRVGYADPPYPDTAERWYGDEDTFLGEVDHRALLGQLVRYDGWALSTSARALRRVLPLCPPEARVAAWVKPIGVPRVTRGPHSRWEPVIYVPARLVQPGKRDWLRAMPARGGDSSLPGRKPVAFYRWLFELLGMAPQDSLADLYPGSKMGSRCWAAVSGSRSRRVLGDDELASLPAPGDTASMPRLDAQRSVLKRIAAALDADGRAATVELLTRRAPGADASAEYSGDDASPLQEEDTPCN